MHSEREKKICTKKSGDPFLESWHFMNVDPTPIVLRHKIDPAYKKYFSFLNVVCRIFAQAYAKHGQSDFTDFLVLNDFAHLFPPVHKTFKFCRKFNFIATNRKPLFSAVHKQL